MRTAGMLVAVTMAVGLGLSAHGGKAALAAAERRVAAVMERFVDEHGVMMSALDDQFRPFVGNNPETDEVLRIPGVDCDDGEFRIYENTGMVQGAFLAAMCAKYRVTHEPVALERARRAYRGIRRVYELSQPGGEGFYCKPWGRRLQTETSSDQYIYTLAGLDAFYPLATAEEQAEIAAQIEAMCRFWVSRKYKYKYYSHEIQWQPCRFLSFVALGLRYGRDREYFQKELERMLADNEVLGDVPFKAAIRYGIDNKHQLGRLYWVNGEAAMSGFLSVAFLLREQPKNGYANNLLEDFRELATVSLAGDGTCYHVLRKLPDGTYRELDKADSEFKRPASAPPWNWALFGLTAPYRMGAQAAAMAVNALVQMAPYDAAAAQWCQARAEAELLAIEKAGFTWFADPHDVLLPSLKWMTRVRSGDAVANWLWAYWLLRELGFDHFTTDYPKTLLKVHEKVGQRKEQ